MEDQLNNQRSDLGNLSIKDLFFKYVRFLPLFLLSVALSLFVAYIYLRYATDIYSTSGTMMIKSDNNGGGNDKFREMFEGSAGNQSIQSEIENLKSKSLMERVVKALDLQVSYFAVGKIKSPNIYKSAPFKLDVFELADTSTTFGLNIKFVNNNEFRVNDEKALFTYGQVFKNKHGVFRLSKIGSVERGGKEFNIVWQPSIVAAAGYASAIVVVPKSVGTNILLILMESANPHLGADIINQLMVEYQKASVEDKSTTARQSLEFIDDRLDLLQNQLDSIDRNKRSSDITDIDLLKTVYLSNLTETDREMFKNITLVQTVEMLENYLRNPSNFYAKVPFNLGIEDPTLNALIDEYNKQQLQRQSLLDGKVPPGNILVKKTEEQIEKLRINLLENLRNLKVLYNQIINDLERRSRSASAQIRTIPEKESRVNEIARQLAGKEGLYKFLQEKREETAISQASTISNSRIVDRALAPSTPIKPNRRSIQIMAILIGLGIPALIIFLLELLNDKITTRYDIEKITQAPVLGEVGHSYSDSALAVSKLNRGMVAEQFRIIRSNLQYVLNKIEKPTMLVTSSFSGEGKSFVSTNLGAVMALAGKKTIVLEFDIRKPKILSGLRVPRTAGITNFLLGKADIKDLPVLVPGYDNLYVLACGPVPPNPAELLLEQKVTELFQYLKENFDVIFIDTAPVGMVSDAMTLSKFADCTLYIVRQGHTYKKQVALIDEFYKENKLPKISIIINDVKLKPGYGYYGYGRYGYGYGYGSGYYEEEAPLPSLTKRLFGWMDVKKWNKKRKRRSSIS